MMNGKRNKIIIGILAVIGLIALLGDNIFRILSVLFALLLLYTGAKILRKQTSRFMILAGIGMIILGVLVLIGKLSFILGAIIIVGGGAALIKMYKDNRKD